LCTRTLSASPMSWRIRLMLSWWNSNSMWSSRNTTRPKHLWWKHYAHVLKPNRKGASRPLN
jgi:hypothetical protein